MYAQYQRGTIRHDTPLTCPKVITTVSYRKVEGTHQAAASLNDQRASSSSEWKYHYASSQLDRNSTKIFTELYQKISVVIEPTISAKNLRLHC
jgi:Skp family chaperone for outer membrane proteins